MDTSTLQILKLDPEAKLPVRQTSGSAGYDLYSLTDGIIETQSRLLIPTGIAIKLPANTVGLIKSRSGLSVRAGLEHGAGDAARRFFCEKFSVYRFIGSIGSIGYIGCIGWIGCIGFIGIVPKEIRVFT